MSAPNDAVVALELAVKRWLAKRYELAGVDDDGRPIYETHPQEWREGDLDFVIAVDHVKRDARDGLLPSHAKLLALVEEARERGVNTIALDPLYSPANRRKPLSPWVKGALALAGLYGMKKLLEPRDYEKRMNELPQVDIEPAQAILSGIAMDVEDAYQEPLAEATREPEAFPYGGDGYGGGRFRERDEYDDDFGRDHGRGRGFDRGGGSRYGYGRGSYR